MPRATRSPRRALPAALAAASVALAAGCGSDAPTRLERPVLRVTLDEYAIAPQDVSVPPGRLRLVARNVGRLTHNLRVETPADEPDEQARELGGTPTAQPGETVRGSVVLRPGTYVLRCTLANHDDLGMTGTLVVRKG